MERIVLRVLVSPPNRAQEVFGPVRSQWLWTAIDRLQAAAGRLLLTDRTEIRGVLFDLSESVPKSINWVERLILHWLLLQFAAESGNAIHARVHAPTRSQKCPFIPWLLLEDFCTSKTADPVRVRICDRVAMVRVVIGQRYRFSTLRDRREPVRAVVTVGDRGLAYDRHRRPL